MSSTNKTTNYELSQFVGSDKPAWLGDYNQDMSKIDTQMKANADAATANAGNITTNTTAIGDLTALNTTAKSNLVSAVNEVNASAGTANGTAQAAATAANGAKTEADALTRYLAITQTGKANVSVSGGTVGNIDDIYYALNADGTLGKVYGRYRLTVNTTGTITVTIPVAAIAATSQFTITGACYYTAQHSNGDFVVINARDMVVNTNGNCEITFSGLTVGDRITLWLPPCLYFFTDFGDVINPNS